MGTDKNSEVFLEVEKMDLKLILKNKIGNEFF